MAVLDWGNPVVALTDAVTGSNLNSLADGTTHVGGEINNETNEAMFMDLWLHLASVNLSAQTNPSVTIHLLQSIDGGTTFDQGDDATATDALQPAIPPVAIMPVRVGTGAEVKESVVTMLPIPPGRWKVCITNETGAAFAASGNTLKYRTYKMEIG